MTGCLSWQSVGVPIQRLWVQMPLQSKFLDFDNLSTPGVILTSDYSSRRDLSENFSFISLAQTLKWWRWTTPSSTWTTWCTWWSTIPPTDASREQLRSPTENLSSTGNPSRSPCVEILKKLNGELRALSMLSNLQVSLLPSRRLVRELFARSFCSFHVGGGGLIYGEI